MDKESKNLQASEKLNLPQKAIYTKCFEKGEECGT